MSRHDEIIRLCHMRDHAAEAIAMTHGKQREDIDGDRLLELALVRLSRYATTAKSHDVARLNSSIIARRCGYFSM